MFKNISLVPLLFAATLFAFLFPVVTLAQTPPPTKLKGVIQWDLTYDANGCDTDVCLNATKREVGTLTVSLFKDSRGIWTNDGTSRVTASHIDTHESTVLSASPYYNSYPPECRTMTTTRQITATNQSFSQIYQQYISVLNPSPYITYEWNLATIPNESSNLFLRLVPFESPNGTFTVLPSTCAYLGASGPTVYLLGPQASGLLGDNNLPSDLGFLGHIVDTTAPIPTVDFTQTVNRTVNVGPIVNVFHGTISGVLSADNAPPVVDAGAPIEAYVGDSVPLSGSVTDDGRPDPPAQITSVWTVDTSPAGGVVTFTNANNAVTTGSFSKPGVYTLKLTASDGDKQSSDAVVVTIKGFNITAPTQGQLFNIHLPTVQIGNIDFSWTNLPGSTQYLVTLRDKNTGRYIKKNANKALNTSFSEPQASFIFGHEYEFSATAVKSGQQYSDTITFKIKVLPDITDPLTQQMHAGQVVWTNTTAALISARNTFTTLLQAKNWTITYNSAYRSLFYQEHLYLIVNNLKDTTLSAVDITSLQQEKTQHQLGTKVAAPSATSPHVLGIAFDANVYDQNGNALNSLTFIDNNLGKLAIQTGFKRPPANDGVHFQLK